MFKFCMLLFSVWRHLISRHDENDFDCNEIKKIGHFLLHTFDVSIADLYDDRISNDEDEGVVVDGDEILLISVSKSFRGVRTVVAVDDVESVIL